MVKRFFEFISEAKKDKNASLDLLKTLFSEKPKIEASGNFPSQQGMYTLSAMKIYFNQNGKSNAEADDAFHEMQNSKLIKSISCKNYYYNKNFPYFYTDLTKEEVAKLKSKIEMESKSSSFQAIESRENKKKILLASAKERRERKTPKASKKSTTKKPRKNK